MQDNNTAYPIFYYDFASVESYIAAERLKNYSAEIIIEWQPVAAESLATTENSGKILGCEDYKHLKELSQKEGLLPLRLPQEQPFSGREALLAATFAKQTGRTVSFSLAAFRQAYAAGKNLTERENILLAAAACELHPNAILKALTARNISEKLGSATEQARAAGIRRVPALSGEGYIFDGNDGIDDAVQYLQTLTR